MKPEIALDEKIQCTSCKQWGYRYQFVASYLKRRYPHKLCKLCFSLQRKKRYRNDSEFRKKDNARSLKYQIKNKEKVNEKHRLWRKNNTEKTGVAQKDFYHRNRDMKLAHGEINRLKRKGIVIPQPCEKCGKTGVHAHHPDYKNKTDVIWLCPLHHKEEHKCQI